MQVNWRDLDRSPRRRRTADGRGSSLTGGPRGRRMGGVANAPPNELLKPTGLMRRDAGVTPARAAGGLARRSDLTTAGLEELQWANEGRWPIGSTCS
jgi:hypothetical protein